MKQPTNSVTKPAISARALAIFASVCDAMQPAEEAQGPEDYAETMNAIAAEALARIDAFNQHATRGALPAFIALAPAFVSTLRRVAENGYSNLDPDNYDGDKESFDMDMSNAIEETIDALELTRPAGDTLDWLGDLYDIAGAHGMEWSEDDER